jgi:hypothetical protein
MAGVSFMISVITETYVGWTSSRESKLSLSAALNRLAYVHENTIVHDNVNKPSKVNIDHLSPKGLERMFESKFREIIAEAIPGSEVEVGHDLGPSSGADFFLSSKSPLGTTLEFLVECKSNPRPSQVPGAPGGPRSSDIPAVAITREFDSRGKPKQVRSWVFAAPFVSPRLGDICWERGWGWFDLAGNCRISIPGLLYVDRKGNDPIHRSSRPDANLGTPEAAQVIRALLKPDSDGIHWPSQRHLQGQTRPGVSLGLVNKIVTDLRNEGYLTDEPAEGLLVVDKAKLLTAWRDAYRFDRIPKIEWFTLLKGQEIEAALRRINGGNETRIAWASFSAAERQAPMVRQPKYWLMATDEQIDWAVDELKAKPVGSGANLVLMTAPDSGYLDGVREEDQAGPCTHPLQTYVDTWHAGGRGHEAADAVFERRLKPLWVGTPQS